MSGPLRALLAVTAALVATAVVWVLGMRRKDSVVVDLQRRVNRRLLNPRTMATAGRPGADAAVVRHTGRRSGRAYATPVDVVATEDGFLVGLVYGPRTDWAQNVLAAGSAVVVHDGEEHAVGSPRLVPLDSVAEHFPRAALRAMKAFGVTQCLRVERTGAAVTGT